MNMQENEFEAIDNLFNYIRRMQQPSIKVINPVRVRSVIKVRNFLNSIFMENGNCACAEIVFDSRFNTAVVTADVEDIVVRDSVSFSMVAAEADNFEIYPLTNGNIRIAFMFYDALKTC